MVIHLQYSFEVGRIHFKREIVMPNHWLVKTEPETFSFDDLVRDKKTVWDGVRNYQARNNLQQMKKGDAVLVYHSISDKAVVGVAEVSKNPYPDPTDNPKQTWVVVDM